MHLFSYGTLQPGQLYFPEIQHLVRSWQRACAPGWQLWNIPRAGYPAVTRADSMDVVTFGTLFHIHDSDAAALLAICDRIEGCTHQTRDALYLRTLATIHPEQDQHGQDKRDAYIYYWNPTRIDSLEHTATRVDQGDWLATLPHKTTS